MAFPWLTSSILFLFLTPVSPFGTVSWKVFNYFCNSALSSSHTTFPSLTRRLQLSNTATRSPTTSVTSGLTPTATRTGSTSPTGTRSPTPSPTGTISTPATPSVTPSPSTSPGVYPGHAISVIDTTGNPPFSSPLKPGCIGVSSCGPVIVTVSGGGPTYTYGTSAFFITPHPVFDVLLTSITFPLQCVASGGGGRCVTSSASFTADLYFTNSTSLLPTNLVVSSNNVGLGATANGTYMTDMPRWASLSLNSVVSNKWVIPALPRLPPLATPTSLYVLVLRATSTTATNSIYFNSLTAAPTANTGLLNLTYTYTSGTPNLGTPSAGLAFNSVGVQVSGVVLALPTPTRSPSPTVTPTGTSSRGSSLSSTPTPSSSITQSFSPTPTPTLTPTSSAAAGLRAGQAIAVIDTTGIPSLSSPLLVTGCTGSTACGTALTTTSGGGGGGTTSFGYTAFYITPHPVFDVLLTSITFPLQPNVCTSGYGCGGNAYYTAAFTADLYYTTTSTLIPTTPVVLSNNLNQGKAANATVVANNARYVTLKLNSVNENWMIPAQPRLPSTALNTSLYVVVLRPTAISGGTLYFNKLATPPTVNTGALDFTYTSASSSSQIFTAPTSGLTFGGGVGVLVSGVTLALPSPTSTPTSSPTPTGTGTGTGTPSPSLSSSPSNTATGTRTPSMSTTLTATPSVTTTQTPTPSITASVSPTNLPLIVNNSVVGLSGGAVGGIAVGGIIFVGGLFTLFICTQTRIKKTPSKKAPFASSGGSGPVARRQGGLLGMLGLSGKGGVGGVGSSHKKGVKGGGGGMYVSRPPPGPSPSSSFSAFENPTNHLSSPTSAMNPMLATFAGPGAAAMPSIPLPFERSEGGGGEGGGGGVSLPVEEAGETFESPPSKWAVAMFDYAATQGDELGLLPEDRVWVSVAEEVEGWSRGRVCDVNGKFKEGVEGLFPTGFVRVMSEAQARAAGLALEGPKRVRLVKKMVEVEVEEEVREGEEGEEGVPPEEPEDDAPLPEGWRKKGLKKGASKSGRKLVFFENTVTGAVSYKRPTEPAVKPKLALKKLDDEEE